MCLAGGLHNARMLKQTWGHWSQRERTTIGQASACLGSRSMMCCLCARSAMSKSAFAGPKSACHGKRRERESIDVPSHGCSEQLGPSTRAEDRTEDARGGSGVESGERDDAGIGENERDFAISISRRMSWTSCARAGRQSSGSPSAYHSSR